MKKYIFLSFLILYSISILSAQDNTYSKYYYQRVSQFEILPIVEEDIVFIGNSITDYCEWAELFQNPNIKNRGISGDVAEGVLNRLSPITEGRPKKIFLMIGINDMIKGRSPETIAISIDKIVQKLQHSTPNTKIYLQSVLPANRKFSDEAISQGAIIGLNNLLKEIAFKREITYIDLHSNFIDQASGNIQSQYSNDGLHLMGKGYSLWRDILLPYINE